MPEKIKTSLDSYLNKASRNDNDNIRDVDSNRDSYKPSDLYEHNCEIDTHDNKDNKQNNLTKNQELIDLSDQN